MGRVAAFYSYWHLSYCFICASWKKSLLLLQMEGNSKWTPYPCICPLLFYELLGFRPFDSFCIPFHISSRKLEEAEEVVKRAGEGLPPIKIGKKALPPLWRSSDSRPTTRTSPRSRKRNISIWTLRRRRGNNRKTERPSRPYKTTPRKAMSTNLCLHLIKMPLINPRRIGLRWIRDIFADIRAILEIQTSINRPSFGFFLF